MSATTSARDAAARYGRTLQERFARSEDAGPAWLRDRQRDAATRLQLIGFPDAKAEDWRYTPLQGLLGRKFRAESQELTALTLDDIDELLLRNSGRVLTRMQIIDRVWGSDYVGDTKTLDVHVKRLRSKIEADPANPVHIVTVRGLGYKLEG